MTRAYYWFWKGLLRDVGGSRAELYLHVLPLAFVLWFIAGIGLYRLGEMSVDEPKVYITEGDCWRSIAESYKKRLHEPWQIEAGQHYDFLVERMEERLAQAERGF